MKIRIKQFKKRTKSDPSMETRMKVIQNEQKVIQKMQNNKKVIQKMKKQQKVIQK